MTETVSKKLFGTDGIRGKANVPPLDPETLVGLGSVLGRLIRDPHGESTPRVLLGHDGRISGAMIRTALTAGLLSQGLDAFDGGLVTTPALAHETRLGGFVAGVMISASHNAAPDNGIKIFGRDGRKIPDELEARIEQGMHETPLERPYRVPGRARRLEQGADRYRAFLHESFPELDLAGVRILVDCAHGGGAVLAPQVLADFGAEVIPHDHAPDGNNINAECGALHPDRIAKDVPWHGCRLGLCLDGDGDRAIFVDETGQVVHGDALLTLLAIELDRQQRLAGRTAVVTVMSNLGLKKELQRLGIHIVETPVGDRQVMAAMCAGNLNLGGENSGHIIFGEKHNFTGDGLFTCLEVLSLMHDTGRPLSALASCFAAFPQRLVNVPVTEKPELSTLPVVTEAQRTVEDRLGADGRVVLRYSGTENLCRVMIEAPTEELVQEMTDLLVDAVKQSLGG